MNSFGTLFKISIFGESHGDNVGVIIDGLPSGIPISIDEMQCELNRRKSGGKGTTPRVEADIPRIVSGWFNGVTTGSPLTIIFDNQNTKSGDYLNLVQHPRPGHSDFVAKIKYNGYNDYRGGGHFSARVTLGIVAAGYVAKQISLKNGISFNAIVSEIGGESDKLKFEEVIDNVLKQGDSVGGIVTCNISGCPVGLGEPFFDSVESLISHAVFSIPGVRGIEFGEGFSSARKYGSQHNDSIIESSGKTLTNNCGGINGGITNGNDITFKVAIKPTSSISKPQNTYNFKDNKVEELRIKGRHDCCIALRTPVIVEAMCAIVITDLIAVYKANH